MFPMDSGFFLSPVQQVLNLLTFSMQWVARLLPLGLFAATITFGEFVKFNR